MREAISYIFSAVLHAAVLLWLALCGLPQSKTAILPLGSATELFSAESAATQDLSGLGAEVPFFTRTKFDAPQPAELSPAVEKHPRLETRRNVPEIAALHSVTDLDISPRHEKSREFRSEEIASHRPEVSSLGGIPPSRRLTSAEYTVIVEAYRSEMAASQPAAVEVDQLPRPLAGNLAPPYPPDALAAGQQGRAILLVFVGANGAVVQAKLSKSSGARALDDAALAAVQQWQFSPALRGGQEVAFEILVPIRFEILNNGGPGEAALLEVPSS